MIDNPPICYVHPSHWGDITHWQMAYMKNDWPLETPDQWADLYRKLTVCERDQTFGGDVWRAIDAVLSREGVQEACIAKGYISIYD